MVKINYTQEMDGKKMTQRIGMVSIEPLLVLAQHLPIYFASLLAPFPEMGWQARKMH